MSEARRTGGKGFADAVTVSWGDPSAQLYGFARLGIADGKGSALAVLFERREPVGVVAEGGLDVPDGDDWALEMGPIAFGPDGEVRADLGDASLDLRFEATGPAVEVGGDVAKAGGMEGHEQPGRVRGVAVIGGRRVEIDAAGQRGHQWGAPDWDRIALARTVTAWGADGRAIALSSIRPAKAKHHADEALWGALLGPESGEEVADPRLSTTYDGEGRQRRAGLELWVHDDDPYPIRASGEVLCGSTLDLGKLRLDCAFFAWRVDGAEAVGRYDVLRRA